MTSVWRHLHLKLGSFCVENNWTSFLQTCGLRTVQISIQLTMRSGLWCSVVFTRRKFTLSTNWSSGWLKSGAALNSWLLIWLLSSGVENLELVCVRKERGHFEHSLWTYWLLILSTIYHFCVTVLCFVYIFDRWVKQRCRNVHIHTTVCLKKTSPTFLAVTIESIVGFS